MYLNKECALSIESCIKQIHLEMAKTVPCGKMLDLNEGIACFAGSSSFFSQVISWGFTIKPKQFKSQIQAIEQFYHALNHPYVDIQLCSLVGNDLFVALGQRGYHITELSNIYFLELKAYSAQELASAFKVQRVPFNALDEWANRVALGYGRLEAREQFAAYARLNEVTVFAVYNDQNQIIAGATLAIHNGIADLGVTSTLPMYRNKGLQKLLLKERLAFAQQQGVSIAVVTTEPGTVSDINVQKIGFRLAYNRIKMTYMFP